MRLHLGSRLTRDVFILLAACAWPVYAQEQAPAERPAHVHTPGSLFETREGSGTAWLPDLTPMYGIHRETHDWEVMLQGNGFLQFLHEAAPEHRGASQAGSINWVMAMARRPLGSGKVGLRGMLSLEPWTIPGCGYPNLLATGELCKGDNIHDRQHPHDLLMELAAETDRPLGGALRWQLYGGLAGEPALGPVAFPHRISAMSNPLSPIAHHWLDATHISFGVVTAGLYAQRWKAEASVFNGREPDERRTDIDFGALDSMSGRFSFMPTASIVVQGSAGHLRDADTANAQLAPANVDRVTASAIYHRLIGTRALWATSIAWGANRELGVVTHGLTAETTVNLAERHTWFGRVEINGKNAHDLHVHEFPGVFVVGKIQGGYTRYLAPRHGLTSGFGGSLSASFVPPDLQPRYGGVGIGVGLFVTLRPAPHEMAPGSDSVSAGPAHFMVQTALDPRRLTCSPAIDPATAPSTRYQGRTYYFCSAAERDEFLTNPAMSLLMAPSK
jgi:YHS domain-containing protein